MTNINDFIKQENLEKMNYSELMELWGFLQSDHNKIYLIDRIQNILDKRSKNESKMDMLVTFKRKKGEELIKMKVTPTKSDLVKIAKDIKRL